MTSSKSASLFVRGASPAAIGTATAGISGSKAPTLNAQIQAISTAGSMNELIETIPSRYRPLLAPILREMQDIHGKFCNAQKNLATLRAHQKNGTWPLFLATMNDPSASIQAAKEARSPMSQLLSDSQKWFRLQKEEALCKVIALKEAEVGHLDNLYSPSVIRDSCSKELDSDWAALKKALGKFTEDDSSGQGIAVPGFFKSEFSSAKELIPSWVAKCSDFTRIKSTKLSKELERTTELAQQDADAMEIDSEKQTLQETVQKAVEAALRQQNKPAGKTKSRSNKVLPSQKYNPTACNSSLGKRKEPYRDEACLYPEQTLRHQEGQGLQKRRKAEMPIEWTRIGSFSEKREEGEKGKEDFIRSARWSVNNPSSIPREILDLAPETALSIIQSRVPLTPVSNADARIKLGPGVTSVPEKIDDFLSLCHRFLSPSVFNVSLPLEDFSSLSTHIKWKVFFAHKQAPSDFLERNPQYRIPKPETIAVPAPLLSG